MSIVIILNVQNPQPHTFSELARRDKHFDMSHDPLCPKKSQLPQLYDSKNI